MEILTKKNFIIALIFIININYISSNTGICKTIDNCLRCPNENRCLICKFGYRLSKDRTKCMTLREYIKAKRNMAKSSSNKETESSSKESINKKSKDEANESSNSLNKTIEITDGGIIPGFYLKDSRLIDRNTFNDNSIIFHE